MPIIQRMRKGTERASLKSLAFINECDNDLSGKTILNIMRWIIDMEIDDPYHLGDSNCQHFARRAWGQLSQQPYPYPAKYKYEPRKFCLSGGQSDQLQ